METPMLHASRRDILGKKTRFLRRQGITPAHLFGHDINSLPLQCDTAELQRIIARAGKTRLISLHIDTDKPRNVFIREIQRDPCRDQLLHVDFYQVRKAEKIKVDVPIVLVGEAPALKEKGRMLLHAITSLSVECLPDKLPPQIEVDLSSLVDADQAIYVNDIVLSPDITVITAPDQMVVKVSEAALPEVEKVVTEVEERAEEVVAEEGAEERTAEKPER